MAAEQNDPGFLLPGCGPGLAEFTHDFAIRRHVAVERALKIVTDDFSIAPGEVGVGWPFVPGAAETDHGDPVRARSEDVFDILDARDMEDRDGLYFACRQV